MIYIQAIIAIYILFMFIFLMLNYRGYIEVPKITFLPKDPPPVSVILPVVRDLSFISNMVDALQNCISSLGRQDYPNLEVLVVAEKPSSEITQTVKDLAKEYPHIHFHALPEGHDPQEWSGHAYAQHFGALKARGDWYLFLDPRVMLQPNCISRCVAYSLEHKIDGFCLMPGQELRSFWDKLVLPIVFGWFGTRFSINKVNNPESSQALGIRQYMLVRKTAYQMTGGFQKVRHEILEDSALAREFKRMDLHYRLAGGKNLVTTRVYGGLKDIWESWSRIFVGEVGSSPMSILWTLGVIGITSIVPFISFLWCAYVGFDAVDPLILAVLFFQCIMVLTARLVLDTILGIGVYYAFLQPIGATIALGILMSSLIRTTLGTLEHAQGRVHSEL